jgi:hypothetical protein
LSTGWDTRGTENKVVVKTKSIKGVLGPGNISVDIIEVLYK